MFSTAIARMPPLWLPSKSFLMAALPRVIGFRRIYFTWTVHRPQTGRIMDYIYFREFPILWSLVIILTLTELHPGLTADRKTSFTGIWWKRTLHIYHRR